MRAAVLRLSRRVSGLFAAGLRLSGALLQVLSAVVVARVAGVEHAGYYFVGFATATLLATLCRAGFDQALTRLVATDLAFARVEAARAVCRRLLRRFLMRCAWVVPSMILALFVVVQLPNLHAQAELAINLVPFVLAAPLLGAAMLSGTALQAAGRSLPSVVTMFYLQNLLVIGAASLSARWIEAGVLNWTFLAGCGLAALFGQVQLALAWRKKERDAATQATPEVTDRDQQLAGLIANNAWTVVGNLALTWGPLALLGALSSPAEAARYGIAARCAQLVSFALPALNFVLAPRFAALCATRQFPRLRRTLVGSLLLSTLLSSTIALPMISHADHLMTYFGSAYAGSALILVLLAFAQWANGAAGAAIQYLAMTGSERPLRNGFIFTTALFLPVGTALVWTRGAVGAALLTLGSATLLSLLCIVLALRRSRTAPEAEAPDEESPPSTACRVPQQAEAA